MEGVVDHHMRQTMGSLQSDIDGSHVGIDACVTEFIRITDHTLPRRVFVQSCPELIQNRHGLPVRVQLLGSNPQALASNARKAAQLGAPAVDLNFGCPAKTVNKNRGGACLLNETHLISDIVVAVREAVPTDTPVTVKIRLGYEERNSYLANARAIEQAGANELIVHARSKADGYQPPAYWHCIGEIKKELSIPVIANGEIWSVEDYLVCREQSGCEDVMLGRGLLAKPDLAHAIKAHVQGRDFQYMPWTAIAEHMLQFFLRTCETYPAKYTGNRLKQWLYYLQKNYPEAKQLFDDIKRSRDKNYIENRIHQDICNQNQRHLY